MVTRAVAEAREEGPGREAPSGRHVALALGQHLLFITALLLLWELLAFVIGDIWISRPLRVGIRWVEWIRSGFLLYHLRFTLYALVVGFAIGASSGLATGFGLAEFRRLGNMLHPYVVAAYGIPRTALAPLFILWLGIGMQSKVAQAGLMAFFMVFFNTYAGLMDVDKDYVDMCRTLGASRWQVLSKIKLPAAFPYIITGIRVAVPQALLGTVVAEFIASNRGLGYLVVWSTNMFDTTGTFTALLTLMLVVLLLNQGLNRAENYVLRWRPK